MRRILIAIGFLLMVPPVWGAVPELLNYQGILKDGSGNPVANGSYSVTFTIYDAPAGGTNLWAETQSVTTTGGLFSTLLGGTNPIPDSAFAGVARYLAITVSPDPEMAPRQRLTSVGYSYRVSSVDSAFGGAITSKISIGPGQSNSGVQSFAAGENDTASGAYSSVSGGIHNVASGDSSVVSGGSGNRAVGNVSTISGGALNSASGEHANVGGGISNGANGIAAAVGGGSGNLANGIAATVGGGYLNLASGNEATIGGGQLNQTFNQYATIGGGYSNVANGAYATVGGGSANAADGNRATVGGGDINQSSGSHATIGGGRNNTSSGTLSIVGGGTGNNASGATATVSGGSGNTASFDYATVGGGGGNNATSPSAVIAGGFGNNASGNAASVGGGAFDTASGISSTVPGGASNKASGNYSLAAGRRAKALHGGSFVWADSSVDADFESTAKGQFLIRASGGVGVGTNSPTTSTGGQVLHVNNAGGASAIRLGDDATNGIQWELQSTVIGATGALNVTNIDSFSNPLTILANGRVGIGTIAPAALLHVNGSAGNGTGVWSTVSDRRLKRDIEPLEHALELVNCLQPVSFRWRDAEKDAEFGRVRGLIAQDVEQVIPEWVKTDPDGFKRIETIGVDALLIEAVKELDKKSAEVAELKDRLARLEETVARLADAWGQTPDVILHTSAVR